MPRTKGGDLQDDVAKQLFTYFLAVGHLVQKELFKPTLLWSQVQGFPHGARRGQFGAQFRNKLSSLANLQAGSQTGKSSGLSQKWSTQLMGCAGCSQRCWRGSALRRDRRTVTASLGAIVDKLHLSDSEFDPVLPETCTLVRTRSASSFLTDWSNSDDIRCRARRRHRHARDEAFDARCRDRNALRRANCADMHSSRRGELQCDRDCGLRF